MPTSYFRKLYQVYFAELDVLTVAEMLSSPRQTSRKIPHDNPLLHFCYLQSQTRVFPSNASAYVAKAFEEANASFCFICL